MPNRGTDPPHVIGYAAVFYDGTPATEYLLFEDLKERVMRGAFDRSLKEDDVRALFNHDSNFVLGRMSAGTLKLRADNTGLNYDILPPATQAGRDVCELVRRRDVTGSSFGFLVRAQKFVKEKDGSTIRELHDCQLFDISPVTFPAYESTTAAMRASLETGRIQRRFLPAAVCAVELIEGTRIRGRFDAGIDHGGHRDHGGLRDHLDDELDDLELELADAEAGGDRRQADPELARYLLRAASILE